MNNKHGLATPDKGALRLFMGAALCLASAWAMAAHAVDPVDGYLCCNAYSDGQEISDLNAPGAERHRVPVGSPVHVTSLGKHSVKLDVENKKQKLLND